MKWKIIKVSFIAVVVIAIACLGYYGSFYVAGYGEDNSNQSQYRNPLEITKIQLGRLKDMLLIFKTRTGRYPTNDEGLAAIDNYQARFVFSKLVFSHPTGVFYLRDPDQIFFADKNGLAFYKEKNGHVPGNASEYEQTLYFRGLSLNDYYKPIKAEIGISDSNDVYFLDRSGVLTPWLTSYLYENRNGLDKKKFKDSPVNKDKSGRYSIKIDEGIYVYSIGGQVFAEKLDKQWWEDNWPRFMGAGLLIAALVCVLIIFKFSRISSLIGLLILGGTSFLGYWNAKNIFTTCYEVAIGYHLYRPPEMIVRQKEILDKYRDEGVISRNTYDRMILTLEKGPQVGAESK